MKTQIALLEKTAVPGENIPVNYLDILVAKRFFKTLLIYADFNLVKTWPGGTCNIYSQVQVAGMMLIRLFIVSGMRKII